MVKHSFKKIVKSEFSNELVFVINEAEMIDLFCTINVCKVILYYCWVQLQQYNKGSFKILR